MRIPRALTGALLWILGGLLGVVAVVLCLTVILLPLGLPLLWLARRLLTAAVRLMLPRAAAHPVDHATRQSKRQVRALKKGAGNVGGKAVKRVTGGKRGGLRSKRLLPWRS